MKLDLEKLDEGVWVEWKDGVEVKIRPLPVSKSVELQKKATRKKFEFVDGRRQTTETIDGDKYNDLLQAHLIEDWRGFYDQNDEPIPCNAETKKAILDYMHEFRLFVVMAGRELEAHRQEQQEKEEKNSSR
jgi:hypothetical protein